MPRDEELGPQLSGRLGYLFKRAQKGLGEFHEELLAPFGINARELSILMLIGAREPESQQQVAQRIGVDRTSMVALLDALERKALLARRPDAADRRRNVIELTDAGRSTLRDATRASDQAEQQLLADLDETEATQLRSLLRRLASP